MKEENKKINYPRFISNKPCGIDKFEGKSQERLTNAIANHITSTDENHKTLSDEEKKKSLPRIIGLEGGWGVGKSNVIKQLTQHKDLKDKYFLFEYDAWGHQEDLQRRSFLELLTEKLINKEILDRETWNEKLKYLLARKKETITEKYPRISNSMVASFLVAVTTPLFIFGGYLISKVNSTNWALLALSIITPFIPFLSAFFVWLCAKRKNPDYGKLDYLLAIYTGKIENDICHETISENEPTISEFKAWMQDISDYVKNHKKRRLIIVYDNMDRLPAEKVKQLWSSIHTFFSEDGFENVWAIIPFDEKHLSCAFGESDNKEQLTKYFISKTFPVVYRVTFPVITDFKEIFNTLFKEAFGNTENKQKRINSIYRLENPNATVREVIEFINQLVALKRIWHEEIDILYLAIFTLKKDIILSNANIAEQILSGAYLSDYILGVAYNDEILQKNISALVYGVSLDKAEQIPMSKYLDRCFNQEENTDIDRYASSSNFIQILDDKVRNAEDVQIDNIIRSLSRLDTSIFQDDIRKIISSLWKSLAVRKMKLPLARQEFNSTYQKLLLHTKDFQKEIVNYLCKQIQNFKEFNSKNYYEALSEIEKFMRTNNIDIKIADNLNDVKKDPEIFIDYVLCAKENYLSYKLTVNPDELIKYLSDRVTDKWSDLEVLKYLLKDKKYQFDTVKTKIEETIQNQQLIKENNFKPLLDAYKILSDEKPLKVQLNPTQQQYIWNALYSKTNTPEFLEIVIIQIANGTNTGGDFDNEQIKYIAKNLDYYANYGDLLIKNLSWNIPHLTQALKYMTENKLGYILSLEESLPKFFEIKNNLSVSESILLEQFNDWEKHKDSITKENIQSVFQNIPQFFQFSVATKNNLTEYLNKTIFEKLSEVSTDTLYQQRQQSNYFWNIIIKHLIDTDFLKPLPNNLTELGKKYLDDIAASRLAIPNADDIIHKLIEKLDRRKTKETITNIRNQMCNNIADYTINANKFLFLHEWFEKQGDLQSRAGDVCQYILSPVINNANCLKIIFENADFYVSIINSAEAQADTFKSSINNKLLTSTDINLISFAKKIGIEKEKQE